ncbi:MAG: hypothetical protein AMXMBFR4_00990 [Candidatus Hydrogenedentota bacterium]
MNEATHKPTWTIMASLLFLLPCPVRAETAVVVGGKVYAADTGRPLAHAFVGLSDTSFQLRGQSSTDATGAFTIALQRPIERGYLSVQPPAVENQDGIGVYRNTPRIYAYRGETRLALSLPPAGCLVILAYNRQGHLMRWEDFQARGVVGNQFMYATDLEDCALEATCWPVFDEFARERGQPREKGLPALVLPPRPGCVVQALFWETADYGKLLLRADNAGHGFDVEVAGSARVIELNIELARTAVHDLERRQFHEQSRPLKRALDEAVLKGSPVARAAAADGVLADALRLRDRLELERARSAIPAPRADFSFGVFEGSPYKAGAFELARSAGFDLATLLLGWNWTDAKGGDVDVGAVDATFGITALEELGYRLKSHGSVWLQDYGILPDRARDLPHDALRDAMLAQQRALLDAFAVRFSVWEIMNEPNSTNVVRMPQPMVFELVANSAKLVSDRKPLTGLVNGAHEGDYGRRFFVYGPDNNPVDTHTMTYAAFLARAKDEGVLASVDAIGLQYYPGFHFNESFGGLQGPATTPSWLVDMLERYAKFGKPIHITEFSAPSSYAPHWTAGYWRAPWDETIQADYAEAVYTIAYANPAVRSITWWDITDAKSSVVSGGLCDADGRPKPVFNRIASLIRKWKL